MIAQTPRDPWRTAWRIATSDLVIAALLLSVAAGLVIATWLHQTPVGDPAAYAQWFSETSARFGNATPTMQALGLFDVIHSFGFRVLLALLAGSLLLRLIESSDQWRQNREVTQPTGEWRELTGMRLPDVVKDLRRWRYRVLGEPPLIQADRWPWADLFSLLAHGGGLLLLIGLLVTHLWGWRVEGVIVQSGQRVMLPGAEEWVALGRDTRRVAHSPGIVTFVEGRGPGVRASASDSTGRPLSLYRPAAETDPGALLTMALTEDQYFAIPEAQLIVRLAPQPDHAHATAAHSPVLVQVYRSPPGRLATETVAEGDTELTVDDVTLQLTSVPYARLTAVFNPGLGPTGAGLVLLVTGVLGGVVWPVRRLWLREESERIETTGDILPTLSRERDA